METGANVWDGEDFTGKRRHDLYEPGKNKATEVKEYTSGKVYLSKDIEKELLMDIRLLNTES